MPNTPEADSGLGARGAFLAAALFVALIVLFSLGRTTRSALVLMTAVAVLAHLALLPTILEAEAASWARHAGYGWIVIDVVLNGATLNGADPAIVMPLRLGGHFLAAVWIASAAWYASGAVRAAGVLLATLLCAHALAARWVPEWTIYPPFALIPVWLTLLGLRMRPRAGHSRSAAG